MKREIRMRTYKGRKCTAYIELPGYPYDNICGCVAKSTALHDLIADYKGPRIQLDFDKDGLLIGIEILA